MRRVVLKSPVLENCTPGSVRGAPGNRRPYLAKMGFLFVFMSLIFLSADLPKMVTSGRSPYFYGWTVFVQGWLIGWRVKSGKLKAESTILCLT
jgi:hypothetical protein